MARLWATLLEHSPASAYGLWGHLRDVVVKQQVAGSGASFAVLTIDHLASAQVSAIEIKIVIRDWNGD